MATTDRQPLLDSSKRTTSSSSSCKTLFVVLSLVAVIFPTTLVTLRLISTNHSDLSISPNICARAHNPASCITLVSKVVGDDVGKLSEADLLQLFLNSSVSRIGDAIKLVNSINGLEQRAALTDCVELMDSSIDRVMDSIVALRTPTVGSNHDVRTWLSAVLTNHVTCLDGLIGSTRSAIETELADLVDRARASLAILNAMTKAPSNEEEMTMIRPLKMKGGFPSWISRKDRKLLEASSANEIKADVVVAKDGSGKYKTVLEAIESAPNNSKSRYVIYVKKGTYKENVEVGKKKKNLMMVGDGMNSTIITGSLNVIDGSTTFNSATFAIKGDGFIAQDIWFQNTAGPEKHQAVALRVGADESVINRCFIDAYQDTLYTHSLRQFYRDCSITGTVDFIFGNAAVVFQNSKIIARKPMTGQNNMLTAQGRIDPNQNTGTSIQNCEIVASSDLEPVTKTIKTYLGRPWKEYSRTVFMQSYIGNHVDPLGWSEWSGDFALKTLYYGEYSNRGPGAGTSKRVNWSGYHVITDPEEAKKFTVAELIQGGVWLKSTGVAYTEGL